jgi:hypothetical protein
MGEPERNLREVLDHSTIASLPHPLHFAPHPRNHGGKSCESDAKIVNSLMIYAEFELFFSIRCCKNATLYHSHPLDKTIDSLYNILYTHYTEMINRRRQDICYMERSGARSLRDLAYIVEGRPSQTVTVLNQRPYTSSG